MRSFSEACIFCSIGVLVQVVVHFGLYEVAYVLVHAHAVRTHGKRAELDLRLALEHRFLYIYGDGGNEAVAYVGIFEVLVEKLLYSLGYVLLERALVRTALGGVLAVDERVVLLAVLVGVGERYLNVFTLEVYYRVNAVGGHRVVEQVFKSVAAQYAATVEHYGKPRVKISVVTEHCFVEECIIRLEEHVCTVFVLCFFGLVAFKNTSLKLYSADYAVAVRPYLKLRT